jgi:phosphoribosylaminoimidazolecarboxamide formyltransferase/IMP cyclohydrolase
MSNEGRRVIRRALVSVYDKAGLEVLAQGLAAAGIEMVSTGSTAMTIAAAGCPVTAVNDVTGFPESLNGRVKTLHPHIHGGILADMRKPEHERELAELGIAAFELVIVNLYPFNETVASGAEIDEFTAIDALDDEAQAIVRQIAESSA